MASPVSGLRTCSVQVNLFSGSRTPLPSGTHVVLTVLDGNQQNVSLPNNGFFDRPQINITGLPFHNNFGDNYTVVVSASGFQQAGFFPVKVNPSSPAVVDLMLLKKDPALNFRLASWTNLNQRLPDVAALLSAGADDDADAKDRYEQLLEDKPLVLACYLNLVTAMAGIQLPVKTPLTYIRQLEWDTMQQDRFFAWAEPALIDQVIQAMAEGEFAPEPGTAIFHPGGTRSWKQEQYGEANVQLTFHEKETLNVGGVQCVKVEPDMDYFKDPLAHTLLEVTPNWLTHSLTDPRQVYVLRWMAGRHAGVPNFDPPYTLE